jgi:flagellar motor switch protein FliM
MVFAAALSEQVNAAECPLTAVLAHLRLPLAEVLLLGAGAVLPLPTAAIDRIDLVGADGRRISGGKLGQTRGMRAVRHEPDSAGSGLSDGAVAAVAAMTRPGARPPPAGLGPAHSANPPRTGTEG